MQVLCLLFCLFSDSSSNMSDVDTEQRLKRREEKRLRRFALFHVFSYLDARSLCSVSMVCREWRRVGRHPALWKNVCLQYEAISSKVCLFCPSSFHKNANTLYKTYFFLLFFLWQKAIFCLSLHSNDITIFSFFFFFLWQKVSTFTCQMVFFFFTLHDNVCVLFQFLVTISKWCTQLVSLRLEGQFYSPCNFSCILYRVGRCSCIFSTFCRLVLVTPHIIFFFFFFFKLIWELSWMLLREWRKAIWWFFFSFSICFIQRF